MQALLSQAMVERGRYTERQAKISKGIIFLLGTLLVTKLLYMFLELGTQITREVYEEQKGLLQAMGYDLPELSDAQYYKFNIWGSIDFEIEALVVNFLLLKYYIGQTDNRKRNEKYHFIHNSVFLAQFEKLKYMFFIALVVDTFMSQTII